MGVSQTVLIVTGQARTVHSGVGTYAGLLLDGLQDCRDLAVTVATWDGECAPERHPRLQWVGLGPAPRFDPTPGRFWSLGRAAARWLERSGRSFDVVHCLDARDGHLLVHRPRTGRLVGTVHDDYAALVGGPLHYFGKAADPWRRWCFHRWLQRVERKTYPGFDQLMVNSQATMATLRQRYGLPAALLTPVSLTIAPLPPAHRPLRLCGSPALLFSGGNFYRKGLDLCVRALPRLRQTFADVRLHVAGSCRSERSLRRLVRRLGVGPAVQFHGRVAPDRMAALLAAADVLVMPSRTEALGLVYLEAFRAGVPVVAGEHGGVTELVRHGESGLSVPPESPAAIAAAVTALLHDEALRWRLIDGGRALLAARTPERLRRETLACYGHSPEPAPAAHPPTALAT